MLSASLWVARSHLVLVGSILTCGGSCLGDDLEEEEG